MADIDGDGLLDLVNVGTSSDCEPGCGAQFEVVVSVAFTSPAGGFPKLARGVWSSGDGGLIAIGDVNLDGAADILLVNDYPTLVYVYLGRKGSGGFDYRGSYPIPGSEGPILIGDFNGDTKPDFITPFSSSEMFVFIGSGDGTFDRHIESAPSQALFASGDVNGDSRLDLLFVAGGVAVMLGNGDGHFDPGPVTSNVVPRGLADVNGDHVLDLLSDGRVMLGRGDGTFGSAIPNASSGPLVIADFNEDGRPDLAFGGSRVMVLIGNGNGEFSMGSTIPSGGSGGLLAHDIDRDGHVDIATSTSGYRTGRETGWLFISPGHGDGTFGGGDVYPIADDRLAGLAVADVNRDRNPDVVVLGWESRTVRVMLGSPSGRLTTGAEYETGPDPRSLVIEDFNQDEIPDLAVLSSGRLSVHAGRGDGTFLQPVHHVTDGWAIALGTGDFNEDGRPDIVVGNRNIETISLFLSGENGLLPRSDLGTRHDLGHLAVGDFTGDGHLDIALGGYGSVGLMQGVGDGRFEPKAMEETPNYCEEEGFDRVAAYDRRGDCHPQIAATWSCCSYDSPNMDCTFGTAFVKFGSRGTLEWAGHGRSVEAPARALKSGDLSGDGIADLVAATLPGAISIETADGAGGFLPNQLLGSGASPVAIAIADMNADGRLDIVVANEGSRTVTVLFNESSRLSIPDAPVGVTAIAGEASVRLAWEPDVHPGVSAYRVYYTLAGADQTQAAEGPSPVTVEGSRNSVSLTCLPDSLIAFSVTAVDHEGRESHCGPGQVTATPLPAGGTLRITPRELNSSSRGSWITATIELRSPFDPQNVILDNVRLNGIAPVEGRISGSKIALKYPRAEVARTLAGTRGVVVAEGHVTGCTDTVRFVTRDTVGTGLRRSSAPIVDESPLEATPEAFRLYSRTPNPVRNSCDIGFDLPKAGFVRLEVYDVTGRQVGALMEGGVPAGRHTVPWDAHGAAGGLYFVRLQAGERIATLRVVLIR